MVVNFGTNALADDVDFFGISGNRIVRQDNWICIGRNRMIKQEIIQVDAFTDRPFSGNPAAVCLLAAPAAETWMQNVAREMNLSETAFLHRDGKDYHLRWFTPTTEVDLCGHATLASAHVLYEEGVMSPNDAIRFRTLSGALTARKQGDWIELDFPAEAAVATGAPPELLAALGLDEVVFTGRNRVDYLIEVAGTETVRRLRPNMSQLEQIPCRGVIVTSRADDPAYDYVSRFFAPRVGVPEDPVTGSAHCCLGPYWRARLQRDSLTGYQASARGGVVRTTVQGDRVLLGGQAVTVLHAMLDF